MKKMIFFAMISGFFSLNYSMDPNREALIKGSHRGISVTFEERFKQVEKNSAAKRRAEKHGNFEIVMIPGPNQKQLSDGTIVTVLFK